MCSSAERCGIAHSRVTANDSSTVAIAVFRHSLGIHRPTAAPAEASSRTTFVAPKSNQTPKGKQREFDRAIQASAHLVVTHVALDVFAAM
jgi:hypothetical protein